MITDLVPFSPSISPAGGAPSSGAPVNSPEVAWLLKRFALDKRIWDQWVSVWEDCYRLAMPYRERFYSSVAGEKRTAEIFDETAVVSLQEFGSRMAAGIIPDGVNWLKLQAGKSVPEEHRADINAALAQVNEHIFEYIHHSNIATEGHEALIEVGVGTGIMKIEPYMGDERIHAEALPLSKVILGKGPDDSICFFWNPRRLKAGEIKTVYPKAILPLELEQMIRQDDNAEVDFLEACYRNWDRLDDEVTEWRVIWVKEKRIIEKATMVGLGSSPFFAARWSKGASEIYGRGPLLNALPAVKTANLIVELVLTNAEIATSGVFQSDNNSHVNQDTVQFLPGTIIPKMAGTSGLEALEFPGNFDVSELVLNDQRKNIKKALFDDDQFGPVEKTPPTAAEIYARQAELARRVGAPFSRLMREMVIPLYRRVAWILQQQGRIKLPRLDNRVIRILPVTPMAHQQQVDDVSRIDRYLEQLGIRFGPEQVQLQINVERTAATLAVLHGVPPEILNTAMEKKQAMEQLQALAQQQMAAQGGGAQEALPAA